MSSKDHWEEWVKWREDELCVNGKRVAHIWKGTTNMHTWRICINIDRDPRTGRYWKSKKQAREFLNSVMRELERRKAMEAVTASAWRR
jgi:hypothetical protein